MKAGDLCILISSCDKYEPLATWTASRIDRVWADHPALFFSGLTARPSESYLPFQGDARDWMSVTLQAVESLLQRGFRWTYLILDDLPPIGECHADFLNRLLPAYAEKAGATMVSLLGWGQHRYVEGQVLSDALRLELVPPDSRWRFSLHPGLWQLERLREVLQVRCRQFETAQHTPWNFERHRPHDLEDFPRSILEACYRVHGRSHVKERAPLLNDLIQSVGCFIVDVALFAVRITRGDDARQKAAARWLWPYCFYRGPYPIFWSGVMRQGKVGAEWAAFLKFFNPSGIAEEWKTVHSKL